MNVATGKSGSSKNEDPSGTWRHYLEQSQLTSRLIRVGVGTFIYGLLALSIIYYFGGPHSPARGVMAIKFDRCVLILLIAAFIVLLLSVIDSTRLCKFMADRLTDDTVWGKAVRDLKVNDWKLDP